MKRIIVYLLALLPLQVLADYVDDINNATGQREAGHQVIYQMNVGSFSAEGTSMRPLTFSKPIQATVLSPT